MKNANKAGVSKLLKPFQYPYCIFCAFLIFVLSVIDTLHGDGSIYRWCDNVNGIDGMDGDVTRGFSAFMSALFLIPLLFSLYSAVKNKRLLLSVSISLVMIYWYWIFFGRFWSC
ncbi:DUF2645 family protein [Rahnella woolbedingensis]|uniref:DUF2645 family protein n=1 Tax=Rahnella woolbedingensis TaxID=1510574 RepID=A0A419N2I2_9GAMM|nr:DUF2645 family protein [Rahnella woolbedingensis]RJT33420.1 DUF2645 family protein [Rahnella woolbedingensis]